MSDLHRRLSEASAQVVSRWSPERAEAAWRGVGRRQQRAAQARALAAATALVTVVLAVVYWGRLAPPAVPPQALESPAVPTASSSVLALEDGSEVTLLTPDTELTRIESSPRATRVRLTRGAARFRVVPQGARTFEVIADEIHATVLGTVFTVELRPSTVRVAVTEGRVGVTWPDGNVVVGPGEEHVVPRASRGEAPRTRPVASPSASATPEAAAPAAGPDWRAFAERGEYGAAYRSLTAAGPTAVRNEPGDLLLAADVTRLDGHPNEAATWLRRVVSEHAGDSRAALAAFTLGRVYLDQLGQPHQAATAFAQARRMAPGGALAEDALAREVEARSRAGDAATARQLAEQYVAQYPSGRRLAAVKRHGDL